MKKLLAVFLAVLVLGGVFAVGASAITKEEYDAAAAEMAQAYKNWTDANDVTGKAEALEGDQKTQYMKRCAEISVQLAVVGSEAVRAENWDAALDAYQVFYTHYIRLYCTTFQITVPDSLWEKVGGEPGTNPNSETKSSFFAAVWQFILRWILLGWLWMK